MGMTIEEALAIKQGDCEGTVDECARCPIGKRLCISGEGAGFDSVFTICSLFNLITESLMHEEAYKYTPEYKDQR